MEKRKDHTRWVIGILLLILFISSLLLYLHLTQGAGNGDNPEIGVLVFKHKTIERKYDSDVIWDKIESGLVIRNKDTIRSGDFSDAVLILKDETKININENSMIYLDVSDDNVNLNFAYGSLSLDQKKNGNSPLKTMKISSGTVVLDLKNTKITIEKKGKEELNFQVKEGNVKLTDGKNEKNVIANETVVLKDKEVIISEVSMNLLQPTDNSILTGNSKAIPIAFQWNVKNENRLKLEIALDSRFTSIKKTYSVTGNSFSTNLETGKYFWRLSTEKGKKKDAAIKYSSFNKFTVLSTSPPTLNYPKNNHKFFYTSVTPMIDFGWNRLEVAKNYKLELSNNSNFSEIIKTIITSNTNASIDSLKSGKYFARLEYEPISKDIPKEKSDVIAFFIEAKAQVEAPALISNPHGQNFYKANFNKSGIVLQVRDSPEVTGYTFQVSKTKNFAKIIKEETTNTNHYKLSEKLDEGEYYWRASGTTREGKKTAYSEVGKFTIQDSMEVELLNPSDKYTAEVDSTITFQWKKLPYKGKFIVDISNTDDFAKKIHSANTSQYALTHKFSSEGKYFWRVISLGEDGAVLTKSKIGGFEIEDARDVVAISPTKNSKVDMSFSDTLSFAWEKNPKFAQFDLELYRVKKGVDELVLKNKTKANSYILRDLSKLDEGKFFWTLQGYTMKEGNLKQGKKITIPFRIYLSEQKEAPKIETSKKMYVE